MPSLPSSLNGTELLIEYFESFNHMPPDMKEVMERDCSPIIFKKNKHISSPLDLKPSLYFIVKGCVRGFVRDEGEEITTWLATERNIVGLTLFDKQYNVQRQQFIQALETTHAILIPHTLIMELFTFPQMHNLARNLLWYHYHEADERNFLIRIPTAEKRIQRLIETHPHLYRRIPSKHLAGFLGIREETLSRLKAKINRGRGSSYSPYRGNP
ncbi:Crp/Fnr family transcriptional regulator [Pedobacter sp. UBA5917]|jgi:CRP-like cAMP-binding protein|uniref:Crp/Fnr family transcriptional regulator n=1 Tax=Pedobacter sp. UBA5917 TaxID=1947061 RepID=UPI0025DC4F62|nr:Crp/Fnr family transcriptional regulator [Pedobacter sp. UBA5917]